MRWVYAIFLVSLISAKEICIREIQNPYDSSFLSIELLKALERAVVESGFKIECPGRDLSAKVEEFRLLPIGLSPNQRTNFYELRLTFRLKSQEFEKEIRLRKGFFQESGSLLDLPVKQALVDVIRLGTFDIIEFIRRVEDVNKTNK
ncbi:MAG: hypothetical protein ABDH18_05500 [Aquificaceae bacterium]